MAANPLPLFDQFAIIALTAAPGEAPRPTVHVSIHPAGAVVFATSIESFCFPDAEVPQTPSAGSESDFYVFVLTNADRERQLGFCRRIYPRVGAPAPRHPIVLCFLSRHSWFNLWSALLQGIEEVYAARGIDGILDVVDELQLLPVPLPSASLFSEPIGPSSALAPLQKLAPKLLRPPHGEPPLGDLDAKPLFQSLSVSGVVQVLCNLLSERRVIFVSSSISRLSASVHAAAALLYPFSWQHVFVPVVPHALLSYCCAPMPFVVGVLAHYLDEVKHMPLEEVSIINLDVDLVEVSLEDIGMLPTELVTPLHGRLDRIVANWKRTGIWEARELLRAFLSFFVGIFGTYRRFFTQQADGGAKFDREAFCSAQGPRIQKFLEAFSQAQMFEVFLHEREKQGNQHAPPQTEFERQAYLHDVTTRGPSTKDKVMETTRTTITNTRNAAKQLFGGLFVKGDAADAPPSAAPAASAPAVASTAATPTSRGSFSGLFAPFSTAPAASAPAAAAAATPPPQSSAPPPAAAGSSGMKSYGTLATPAAKRTAATTTAAKPAAPSATTPSFSSSSSTSASASASASSQSSYVPPYVPSYAPSASSTHSTYAPPLPARPTSPANRKPTTPPLPAPPPSHMPGSVVPPPVPPRPNRTRAPSDLIEFAGLPSAPTAPIAYQPQLPPPLIPVPAAEPPPFATEFRSASQLQGDAFSPRRNAAPVLPPRPAYGLTEADLQGFAPPAAGVGSTSSASPRTQQANVDPFALFASPVTDEAKLSSLPYETL